LESSLKFHKSNNKINYLWMDLVWKYHSWIRKKFEFVLVKVIEKLVGNWFVVIQEGVVAVLWSGSNIKFPDDLFISHNLMWPQKLEHHNWSSSSIYNPTYMIQQNFQP
jgi:hypothetical protein